MISLKMNESKIEDEDYNDVPDLVSDDELQLQRQQLKIEHEPIETKSKLWKLLKQFRKKGIPNCGICNGMLILK